MISRSALFRVGLLALLPLSCASLGGSKRRGAADLPDPWSRIEILARIVMLEDGRTLGNGLLLSFLGNEDAAVRTRAAVAAGRIGDPLATHRLIERLKDPEVEVRRATAMALGLLAAPESLEALTAALFDQDPLTRGRVSEALSRIGQASAGPAIAAAFRRAMPRAGGAILRIRGDDPGSANDPWVELRLHLIALARLRNVESFADAVLSDNSVPLVDWWACVWAAARLGDARLTPILLAGVEAEDPYIRSLSAKGLGSLKSPTHLSVLRRLLEDRNPGVVIEALRSLAKIGAAESFSAVASLADAQNLEVRREALLALASLPPDSRWRSRVIENVGHRDAWIRSAAWAALIRIDADDVGLVLSTIGPDSDWRVRQAVADALAANLGERASQMLLGMLKDDDSRVIPGVLTALSRARGKEAVSTLLDHVGHFDMGVRAAAVSGLSSLENQNGRSFIEAFSRAFDASLSDGDIETRVDIVAAVAKNGSEENRALLRRIAGSDPSRAVRQRAQDALGGGLAPAEETALRIADARRLVSIYAGDSPAVFSPRVLILTRHGTIEMTLDVVDAPLNSMSFVRLAQSGFYNGLTFHRMVPGFAIQGGDPRGDGYGGPGTTVRCEYSGRPFGRGAVGMALSGKDSGGSQFFIALEPQPHLDGAYTQFGQVVSGMEVVEKIRPGDSIERIEILDGRESL